MASVFIYSVLVLSIQEQVTLFIENQFIPLHVQFIPLH